MGAELRTVKRRIRSVQSTKKITRAMELIAASRVVKAQQRMKQSRPYVDAITAVLVNVSSSHNVAHTYLHERDVKRNAAVVVVSSDRGSAGPYNSNVLRTTSELLTRLHHQRIAPKLYVTGRKGLSHYRFRNVALAESWSGFSELPSYDDAKQIADAVLTAYKTSEVDEIYVVFTKFITSLTQRAVARRLLPLELVDVPDGGPPPMYDYEPSLEEVLDALLPRYIEVRMFSSLLEASASEQAARMRAMNTATDNANKLIEELTRKYNRARQAEITQEIMEVVGAAEAFTGSGSR